MAMKQLGYVYFVGAEEVNRVKIGFSLDDPDKRFDTLLTCSPVALSKLGLLRGGMRAEKKLHAKFKRFRIHREWFALDAAIVEFIKERAGVWDEVFKGPSDSRRVKPLAENQPRHDLPPALVAQLRAQAESVWSRRAAMIGAGPT